MRLFEFDVHIGDWRVLVQSHDIQNGSVNSRHIADGAVTSAKIADGAVTSDKIADGAVTSAKIADGAVNANKLVGTFSGDKIAENTIPGNRIEGEIPSDKIADEAVTSDKLSDASVTSAKIADGAVTSAKIADKAVKSRHIADGAIDDLTGLVDGLQEQINANRSGILVLTTSKQDTIHDLASIRDGANKGSTALQEHQHIKTVNHISLVGDGNIDVELNTKTINGQSIKGIGNIDLVSDVVYNQFTGKLQKRLGNIISDVVSIVTSGFQMEYDPSDRSLNLIPLGTASASYDAADKSLNLFF